MKIEVMHKILNLWQFIYQDIYLLELHLFIVPADKDQIQLVVSINEYEYE